MPHHETLGRKIDAGCIDSAYCEHAPLDLGHASCAAHAGHDEPAFAVRWSCQCAVIQGGVHSRFASVR